MNEQLKHYQHKLNYEIDSWDLNKAMNNDDAVVVIDARSREAYEVEHIPGAINIPHREMTQATTAHLDHRALIITYCDGIGCNASTKGALAMTQRGFRVKELMGGLDWWKRDGYPVSSGSSTESSTQPNCGCG